MNKVDSKKYQSKIKITTVSKGLQFVKFVQKNEKKKAVAYETRY